MIRLLHFADLHLGVENYGRLDPESGLSTRLMDFLRAFDFVVEYAIENEIDAVLFAGDAFKNRDPSPTHQREFARRVRRLSDAQVPTFLLVGNHDLPNAIKRAHAIEIFDTLEIPHVTVGDRPACHRIETRRGEPLQVVGVPWVTRSHLLTRDDTRGLDAEEIRERLEAGLRRIVEGLTAKLDPTLPAVMVAHGTVPGATFGMERSVMLGQDVMLDPTLLRDPKFAYVALGHIHKHQVLHDDPPVIYSGSIERIDFGEAKEAKGFIVAEIADGPTRWEFIETPTRPLREVVIDAREQLDPMDYIRERLAKSDFTDAVAKVIIKTTPENSGLIDKREIQRSLEGAAHIAAIVNDVDRPARLRLGSAEELAGAGPRELLARYLEAKQVDPAQRDRLLAAAEELYDEPE